MKNGWLSVVKLDQVYSNTRVPSTNTSQHESTRVNTNQHESDTSQTRVKTNQHESDTSQHKPDTSQHESTRVNTSQLDHEFIIVYRSLVGKLC